MKSNESGCEGTGMVRKYQSKTIDGRRIWFKSCPSCGTEQQYSTLRAISWATTHNKVCYKCTNSGKDNPFFGKKHSNSHRKHLSNAQSQCSYRYKSVGHNPPKIRLICKTCKTPFDVTNCQKDKRKYCCYKCALEDSFGFKDGHKTSPEIKVETILSDLGEPYQYGYVVDGKIYDFYLPEKRLLLEIDGVYWHAKGLDFEEMDETQRAVWANDLKKVDIAQCHGYNMSRIWEDEISKEEVMACIKISL